MKIASMPGSAVYPEVFARADHPSNPTERGKGYSGGDE